MKLMLDGKRGKPRNLEMEIKVIHLLAIGLPPGKVALEAGVHRNTVTNIRARIRDVTKRSGIEELAAQQRLIEQLEIERAAVARRQVEAKRQFEVARYRMAVEALLVLIEKAANAVTKCHSVWTQVSLDKPLPRDGTMHDLISGQSTDSGQLAENAEMSELLNSALEKLTDFQQKVLKLTFWEGQNAGAIATQLGVDETEIREAQEQGIGQLRELVGGTL